MAERVTPRFQRNEKHFLLTNNYDLLVQNHGKAGYNFQIPERSNQMGLKEMVSAKCSAESQTHSKFSVNVIYSHKLFLK